MSKRYGSHFMPEESENLVNLVHAECLLSLLKFTNKSQPDTSLRSKVFLCQSMLLAHGLDEERELNIHDFLFAIIPFRVQR